MDFANTRLCFVTAHLAAGFANYEERNRDYHTIAHGLRFQRNRSIADHDAVLWLGDFNYRIGLPGDRVRTAIKTRDLATLFKNDQLNLQMVAGRAFPFYSEGRITFDPTYKYDNGTDDYDTSEKARIPAWCDRVLWKGEGLTLRAYSAAPLRFSDHRPVFAVFSCQVRVEDEPHKYRLAQALYAQRRQEVGGLATGVMDADDDEDLLGYEAIEPGLPPASSERSKWWLMNGTLHTWSSGGATDSTVTGETSAHVFYQASQHDPQLGTHTPATFPARAVLQIPSHPATSPTGSSSARRRPRATATPRPKTLNPFLSRRRRASSYAKGRQRAQ